QDALTVVVWKRAALTQRTEFSIWGARRRNRTTGTRESFANPSSSGGSPATQAARRRAVCGARARRPHLPVVWIARRARASPVDDSSAVWAQERLWGKTSSKRGRVNRGAASRAQA